MTSQHQPGFAPMAAALARFATSAQPVDVSADAREALTVRILDSLGCALGALGADPVRRVRAYVDAMGGTPRCTLFGGGRSSPDRAALHNGFLVRYLDFNDSYLAPGETCHPSDNLAAVLAAAEASEADGATLLAALAVAYQVQCRLSDVAPVRSHGFDHTVQGSYAVAAGVARAMGLDAEQAAHAIAIAGTAFNALRVTRTGSLSHWKGLAYPNAAFCAVHAVHLAAQGITGPLEVFEGNKGFMHAIAGPFELDWEHEGLEAARRTIVKRYNAEIHSQSALEALQELRNGVPIDPAQVEDVNIRIFDVAFHIIGGGEEGNKTRIESKEQADHSLPYMAAAMLLDGEVTPRQYTPDRICADDVQRLLRRVRVEPDEEMSRAFPDAMPCRVTVRMRDGAEHVRDKRDYLGFHTRPADWSAVTSKFHDLGRDVSDETRHALVEAVRNLERRPVSELTALLREACFP
ncbi:MAG: MmgE/PrpD family protein [Myxococcota bacterium]